MSSPARADFLQIAKTLKLTRRGPNGVRFADLMRVCEEYFGKPRQPGTSHAIFKTPCSGNPRVNIQAGKGGKATDDQVCQVPRAVDKLERLK